jgi:hypothetical protein
MLQIDSFLDGGDNFSRRHWTHDSSPRLAASPLLSLKFWTYVTRGARTTEDSQ